MYPMDLVMLWFDLGLFFSRILSVSYGFGDVVGCLGGLFLSRILKVSYGFGDVVGWLGGYFSEGFSMHPMDLVM